MAVKKGIFIRFNPGEVSKLYIWLIHQRVKAEKELQVFQTREKLMELGSLTDTIEAIRYLMVCDDWLQVN
jgi:hypothetical protein